MPSTHSLPSLTDPSDEQRRLGDDFCDEINRSSGSSACLAYCTSQKRDLTIYPLLKVITITSCLASGVSRQNKISSRLTSRASRYSTTSSRIDLVAHSVAHNYPHLVLRDWPRESVGTTRSALVYLRGSVDIARPVLGLTS